MTENETDSFKNNLNFPILAGNKEPNVQLFGQQLDLYRILLELDKDQMLANTYLGALMVLKQNENPDHLALAAHGVRELIEKIPSTMDLPMKAHGESLKSKVMDLREIWLNALYNSKNYNNQKWSGEIDSSLYKLLNNLHSFFEWFDSHHPRRNVEVAKALRKLDISGRKLPSSLEKLNIEKWKDIRDFFQGVSHHQKRNINADEFSQKMESFEKFLLDRLLPQTFTDINEIDEIILEGESGPEPEVIEKALEIIGKRRVNYEYFFDNLKSPGWIEPLSRKGMFKRPPLPEIDGNYISFTSWSESRYLVRMASKKPMLVLETILNIPETSNIRVHEDFIEAALAMPPELIAKWVKIETGWISSQQQLYFIPEKYGKLISHLACGMQVNDALNMARTLLAVFPTTEEGVLMPSEPRIRFDLWYYEQILKKDIPNLVIIAKEKALRLLCDLLCKVINLTEGINENEKTEEDNSYIWRPAIENHDQNRIHGLNDLLVSAVRDAADALIETKGKIIIEIVEGQDFKVFRRIGLYLRWKWPDIDPESTADLIIDPKVFDDSHLHHELFYLLKDQFNKFPPKIKEEYLKLTRQIINLNEIVASQDEESRDLLNQQQKETSARLWQYKKLWPIQAFLDNGWKKQFDDLNEEFGEIENLDFDFYLISGIGPNSPKSIEELKSMNIDEIISFLESWMPSNDFMSASSEGLGRQLTELVSLNPETYSIEAKRFQNLKPTYVSALISGFRDALKEKKSFQWTPIINLCRWVTTQSRDNLNHKKERGSIDSDWSSTCKAIVDMLSVAFELDEIQINLRTDVWEILKAITHDPDPTKEYEEQYGGSNMDYARLSLNTTRGGAMHSVIRYALWVRRHIKEMPDGKEKVNRGFQEMPEIKEILERHLDPSFEPSLTIRAVYGRWFPWLVLLDEKWAAQNRTLIFPMNGSLHDVAWKTYIDYCNPYNNILDLLREEYLHAIDNIGMLPEDRQFSANYNRNLVKHIMTYYWSGRLDVNDSDVMLESFFMKASEDLRRYAIEFIGRSLYTTKESVESDILNRLKKLLEMRINTIRNSKPVTINTELVGFGWWFVSGKFDDVWTIAQLQEVLELTKGNVEPDEHVVKRLVELSITKPLFAVECLAKIIESDQKNWLIHSLVEPMQIIIYNALQSTDDKTCKVAKDFVERLLARGYLEFRDLLVG